ncbi:unnamed protein product [Arabis nemorensis]|uniref:Uncharacterized protein n=1 Tax=Arabis nemorensis TaxID=586526 RepID=A0A565CNX3_9BRAS|nr:unnamed protein product [Arabis nemorensis]
MRKTRDELNEEVIDEGELFMFHLQKPSSNEFKSSLLHRMKKQVNLFKRYEADGNPTNILDGIQKALHCKYVAIDMGILKTLQLLGGNNKLEIGICVGGQKIEELREFLNNLDLEIRNIRRDGAVLNKGVGADFCAKRRGCVFRIQVK